MKHTTKCIIVTETINKEIEFFGKRHPNYCRTCGGQGSHTYWENVAGDGGSHMQMAESCPDCTEKGICPRCGKTSLNEECDSCTNCAWMYKTIDVCPESHECYCWEEDYEKELNEEDKKP